MNFAGAWNPRFLKPQRILSVYKKGQKVWVVRMNSLGLMDAQPGIYRGSIPDGGHYVRVNEKKENEVVIGVREDDLFTVESNAVRKVVHLTLERVRRNVNHLELMLERIR